MISQNPVLNKYYTTTYHQCQEFFTKIANFPKIKKQARESAPV